MATELPVEALLTPEARARLLAALLETAKSHGVSVERDLSAKRHGGGFYSRQNKKITVSPDEEHTDRGLSVLAHEIGHAEFDKSMIGHFVQDPIVRSAAFAAPAIGMLIASVAEGSFLKRLAWSAGTSSALQVPLLSGEVMADVKGHRMLKEHGASPEMLKLHRGESFKGVRSYLAPGLHGLGSSLIFSAASSAIAPSTL